MLSLAQLLLVKIDSLWDYVILDRGDNNSLLSLEITSSHKNIYIAAPKLQVY